MKGIVIILVIFSSSLPIAAQTTNIVEQPGEPDAYEPTVYVSTKKLNDKIEIKVRDNGNGISQCIVYKIFQPFFTTKQTGQGTGLGLPWSYDIINVHRGEINVKTKEGGGAGFIIELPLKEKEIFK